MFYANCAGLGAWSRRYSIAAKTDPPVSIEAAALRIRVKAQDGPGLVCCGRCGGD